MKCPNCYSRKIDKNNICELCGINIKNFKRKNTSKIVIIFFILLIVIATLFAILNLGKVLNLINTFVNAKRIKLALVIGIGLLGSILMMRGSYIKTNSKKYNCYLLGKIVDYRPFKNRYNPIIEYIVDEKEYRIVAKPTKEKELDGLVGVRYESSNPLSAIIDGEKNGDFDFFLGLFILIIIISIAMI